MNAVGLNGTRLRWKWNQKRAQIRETGFRTELLWRSARTKQSLSDMIGERRSLGAALCLDRIDLGLSLA